MDLNRLAADEYEKQYYGFSSTELIEDFKEHATEVIKKALIDLKNAISAEIGTSYNKESLDTKIIELYEVYMISARYSFERFEAEARTIFAIPKNVLLEEDKLRQDSYSDEDINKLKQELVELEKEYIQEKVFLAKCKKLKDNIETTLKPIYDKVNTLISVAKRMPKHTNKSEEANQQKIIEVHDVYVQHFFNMMKIGEEKSRSCITTEFRTGQLCIDL